MNKIFLFLLTILMCGWLTAPLSAQNTLTVADGATTNDYIPIYGTWADADQHNQVIYPESLLGDMVTGQISSMTFYLTSTPSWTHNVTVSLGIATNDHFSSATHDNATVTQVFAGNLSASNGQITFTFDTPYDYNGGDLLFDLTLVGGSWSSAYFYGTSSSGGSLYQYNSNTNTQNFIPKTTFAYSGGALCKTPSNVTASGITTNEATIFWHGDENASSYNIQYMLSSETDWDNALTATAYDTSVTLTNLQPSSTYKVRVQTNCSDNTQTVWSFAGTFQTGCDAITITDLWFEDFEGYTSSDFVCWTVPVSYTANNGTFPLVYRNYGEACHSGGNSAEFKGTEAMLVLPEFSNDLSTLRLTFWATATSVTTGHIQIGVITDASDTSTFELVYADAGVPGPRGGSSAGNGNLMGPFDFNNVQATSGRIALRYLDPTGSGLYPQSWNLDDFTVTFIPACAEPSGLANVNVTATTADVTWNEVSGSTYDLIYWENGSTDTTVIYGAYFSDNVYTLTNLNPSSSYTWYVRTDCGDGTYALSYAQLSFSTPGLPVELPYERTFEEGDDNPVTEFTFQGTGDNQWVVGTATYMPDADDPTVEGHSLYISNDNGATNSYNSSSSYAYAIMNVEFDDTPMEYHLAFDYKVTGEGGSYTIWDYLSVYLMDGSAEVPTNANPSGTTLLSQAYNVSSWTHADFILPDVTGTSKKIVFYWRNDSYTQNNPPAAIDNISVQGFSCATPSNLTATNITASSALVQWQENGSATSWNVYYRPVGGSDWTMETATDESLEITGLGGNTKYEVYVTADCSGEESSPSATAEFRTLCGNDGITVLPFMEDFEGESVDGYVPCWTRSTNDSTGAHQVYHNTVETWAWGSKALDFGYTPGCYTQAILPMFDSSIPLNTLKVEFDARRTSSEGAFLVGALTDPEDDGTFEVIDTILTVCTGSYSSCSWEHITVYCNNYTGNGQYLAFRADNCGSSSRLIDNLVIDYLPECLPIANLTVSDPTMGGATLSWSGDADSYNVYVGGNVYNTTDTFIVINDLNASSTYSATVRALCAGDSSVLSNAVSFNTACGAITVAAGAPWFEDFEGYTSSSFICWETPVTYTANNGTFPMVYRNYGESCHSGVNSAEFKGTEAMLVLPEFTNDINTLRLSFWATATSISTGHIQIGVITDVTDTSTFELVIADAGTPGPRGGSSAGNGNYMGPFDFNGATATSGRIALRYIDPTGSGMYPQSWNLDDFTVELTPDCPSPVKTSVTATNIDGHNATISWTDNDATHTAWIVYYKASTDSEWSTEYASTTTIDLTNLAPETSYDVYVVTDCGSTVDNPDATLTIHFTTLIACPAPQNLAVSNIGMTSATLTWFSNADNFTIEYGEAGFTTGSGTIVTTTDNTYDFSGLTAGTAYTVYVTADCGADGTSQTATVNFNTNLCEVTDQCEYTFNLSDSYGDGWNGASITIQQNGVTVATVEFTSYSSSATETVTLCDNQPTTLIWNSGSYDTECSFEVLSPSEEVVFTSTGLTSGTVTTFTSSCTPPTCPRPADITVSNIGSTTADVSWTSTGIETAWNVEYKISSDNTWTVIPVTTNPYTLTNLTNLTNYDVRVQADCGNGDVSDYRETSFSTAGCDVADQCAYTFNLTDSYGDGWNGGTLIVQQNGVTVATIAMSDGYTATETINLCDNVSTSLVWNSTSYFAYEAGFSLLDPNGNELYSITGMDNYTTYTFTTDCNGTGPVITTPTVATDAATNITQTSATLNGTVTNPDNISVTPMGFEWKESSAIMYNVANVTGTVLAYPLDNLTPSTSYTYRAFMTYYGMTYYGSEVTFTTLPEDTPVPCDVPTDLTASNITHQSFDVAWNNNAGVSNWNIRYRVANGQWTSATSGTNQYAISGLAEQTTYEVQVQADCGDNNLSEWSELLTVTTLPNGINDHLFNSITIYPNPANDVVNVECTMNNVQEVEVIDVYGKVVRTVVGANNYSPLPTRINVSGLAAGMYFVRVTTEEGVVTKQFVKK